MVLMGNSFPSSILIVCITLLLLPEILTMGGNERDDRLALLAIKSQIHDPLGVTASWNDSVTMCNWKGIKCGSRHRRVTVLNLSFQQLEGSLSSSIGNLSFLRLINLEGNKIGGEIPSEMGKLFRLRSLDLSNNTFRGIIPTNLSYCDNLTYLDLSMNNLAGKIPEQLAYLSKLEYLAIEENNLTGGIPDSIGNLSSLEVLGLRVNNLQGRIPDTLGRLTSLISLILNRNSFSGTFPPSIFNLSSLVLLSLLDNQINGNLPQNSAFDLPNLKIFIIAENNFSGPIPDSIANSSEIGEIDMGSNYFTGKISLNFGGLNHLWWLNLGNNSLGSASADDDISFVTSLTNCTKLEAIGLYRNQFSGPLPSSIANLSITLRQLLLGENLISGTIPAGIGNAVNLESLGMGLNRLSGHIPQSIGKLSKLQRLSLHTNNFVGTIPVSIGNLTRLTVLHLSSNNLQGNIPPSLERCQNLLILNLSRNRLTGDVPPQILSITTLSIALTLSHNHLTGPLPLEVGNLENLVSLDISGNQFHGHIPATLGDCVTLEHLDLGRNSFDGSIPQSLSSLRSIRTMDVSYNRLAGQIPKFFENSTYLQFLNLSYNHLEGQVPTNGVFSNATSVSLIGNKKLCGGLAEFHLPPCKLKESNNSKLNFLHKIILIVVCGVLGSSLLLFVLLRWFKKKGNQEPSSASFSLNSFLQLSYQQLFKATNGFSSTNLLGEGSFGCVYKGILEGQEDGNVVAVKVINLEHKGASKSFIAECEALRNIRHRNLLKVISACSSIDFQGNSFKAIIYDFMPNGSLDQWLHILPREDVEGREPKGLSFFQRLNIVIDVASALDYLHHHCQVPIIHCDVKPSNVLLDNNMVAHLGDFGLARIFQEVQESVLANQTSSLGLKGTVGYVAPEYAMGSKASTSGDTFSFGILLLELFTGKRPTADAFMDSMNLHNFIRMALPEHVLQIADPYLAFEVSEEGHYRNPTRAQAKRNKMKECLLSIFNIGIACSVESPKDRMDISDAARELYSIRDEIIKAELTLHRNNHP